MEIQLTQGAIALIDDADFQLVAGNNWYAKRAGALLYAATNIKIEGVFRHKLMHRIILGAPVGMLVDHVNGNGLDNRRSNLRIADKSKNAQNRLKRDPRAKSPFKGVHPVGRGRVRAKICVNGKDLELGSFRSEIDAARAYDKAAREYFGEFARTNFP